MMDPFDNNEEQIPEEEEEYQFILRLPPHLAAKINKAYKKKTGTNEEEEDNDDNDNNKNVDGSNNDTTNLNGHNNEDQETKDQPQKMQEEDDEDLEYWIEYDGKDYDKDSGLQDRKFIFYYGEEQYDAILMDLPTITESYKTLDNKNLYKSNNICQVLEVASTPRVMDPETKTYPQIEKPNKLFCEDGISRASENIYERFHEPARKLIYGQGGEYPSYKTAMKAQEILKSWLEDKSRTIVREELVVKSSTDTYMRDGFTYDLVDQDGEYPLDGELFDDEMLKNICERIWEDGKDERRRIKEEKEAAKHAALQLQFDQKRKMEEEAAAKKLPNITNSAKDVKQQKDGTIKKASIKSNNNNNNNNTTATVVNNNNTNKTNAPLPEKQENTNNMNTNDTQQQKVETEDDGGWNLDFNDGLGDGLDFNDDDLDGMLSDGDMDFAEEGNTLGGFNLDPTTNNEDDDEEEEEEEDDDDEEVDAEDFM